MDEPPVEPWELAGMESSVGMSSSFPSDQASRLIREVRRLRDGLELIARQLDELIRLGRGET